MESIAGIRLALSEIQNGDFCFRTDVYDEPLYRSIQKRGLLQPLSVVKTGKGYSLIDGHRRLAALKKLKVKAADCFVLSEKTRADQFFAVLTLNQKSRYSELEICRIAEFAGRDLKLPDETIITEVLPLVGLVPSSKVLAQYRLAAQLPEKVKEMIALGMIPFQAATALSKFKPVDLAYLNEKVLPQIKPSASQMAHLCEWWLDLIRIKRQPAGELLKQAAVAPRSSLKDLRARTEQYYRDMRALRFPLLAAKEKAFQAAVKPLLKGNQGIDIKAPDSFEQEGFFLQVHVRDSKALEQAERQISGLKKRSAALFDTLL